MHETLQNVVHCLRLGMNGAGSAGLSAFVSELSERLTAGDTAVPAEGLLEVLRRALAAQERSDFLGLADCLEYEIAPLL